MQALTIQALVNAHFLQQLEVLGFYAAEPLLGVGGAMCLSEEQAVLSAAHLQHLHLTNKSNEAHALVVEVEHMEDQRMRIALETLDFSNICALRELGMRPAILSASAVLLCGETEELIVHQRGPDVATHPNCWHIFGGAFDPVLDNAAGQASLRLTLQRELWEETGLKISLPYTSPLVITKEKTNGFVQCCMLGVPISAEQLAHISGNWEGSIHRVGFHRLAEFLEDSNWVASGKAHIMSWLAMGAPHCKAGQQFGAYTPEQLFELLVKRCI